MNGILVIVALYAVAVWNGFVLKALWAWFLVPQFGFPEIGIAHAVGLSVLIGMVAHQHVPRDDGERAELMVYAFISPACTLAVGWIAKQFM